MRLIKLLVADQLWLYDDNCVVIIVLILNQSRFKIISITLLLHLEGYDTQQA